MDHLTREGALALAFKIRDYWESQGIDISLRLERQVCRDRGMHRHEYYAIRSDLDPSKIRPPQGSEGRWSPSIFDGEEVRRRCRHGGYTR